MPVLRAVRVAGFYQGDTTREDETARVASGSLRLVMLERFTLDTNRIDRMGVIHPVDRVQRLIAESSVWSVAQDS
jgi:hypothetical protein